MPLTITARGGRFRQASITLTASDGCRTATTSFTLADASAPDAPWPGADNVYVPDFRKAVCSHVLAT
jgi:hypothetical protein